MTKRPSSRFHRMNREDPTTQFPRPRLNEIDMVTLHTSMGSIGLRLFPGYTPKTVENFVGLATGSKNYSQPNPQGTLSGPFYDGSIFHRVINGAWIQGGDPTGGGHGNPGYRFGDEYHPDLVFDQPYLLAMANSGPDTNGSQFFITQVRQPHLNFRYPIFGIVVDRQSCQVVDRIAAVPTGHHNRPLEDVVLQHVAVPHYRIPEQR